MTFPDNVDALAGLVAAMTLEEKVALVSGGSAWGTASVASIGLRDLVLSDGPSGVRGAVWDEREPSLSLPSGTALAASWDPAVARRYGEVVAAEARAHGVDMVLGPTINLHRSPLGGRHFEAFSEDPVLTADLAAAYVEGVQASGVAACPKHYVANDFETDRFTADVQVDERALRELYLFAFEKSVVEARAWAVMSAYNSVNGVTSTENALLDEPLKGEWGFDGVVVSDWTAVRSLESARRAQDLAMPGPSEAWGSQLVAAVRDGTVPLATLDEKVGRMLLLAARVGAWDTPGTRPPAPLDGPVFARAAASEGMVLLRNDGVLPLDAARLTRIAVIGESAAHPRIQGGGSATVLPARIESPLEGIRSALAGRVEVDYALGTRIRTGFLPFDPGAMTNPMTGLPGAVLTHLDADGAIIRAEERFAGYILDFGDDSTRDRRAAIGFATVLRPSDSGDLRIGFASPGHGRLFVDGVLVLDETLADDSDQVQAFFSPPAATITLPVERGVPLSLVYEFEPGAIVDGVPGSLSVTFGIEVETDAEEVAARLIEEAAVAASRSEVAIVVVGTNEQSECEGFDRDDLRLPGRQDELVEAVLRANPRTIVVVNAGAPVEMPWRDRAAAVLLAWFGGQEFGSALADVLFGLVEPGGRLPTTWPAALADAPITDVTPRDGVVRYDEGIHIGYRAWLRAGARPAYPFGFGLGYTQWSYGEADVAASSEGWSLRVTAENRGARDGKDVVQVYARRRSSAIDRPALWLVGFAPVRAGAGETRAVDIAVPRRALMHWDTAHAGWSLETGEYELLVGRSVDEIVATTVIHVAGSEAREESLSEAVR
ncbi:glycoside hydrolase family 3 protein [Microbacterium insulae]|uniref:Glycoside hydrolase family 3 protein n=1 Tax=Microbacterium insulae TaxID=483014 RepID=A0ABW3AHA4_9MICO